MEEAKMPTQLELAYIAGLFDGEGCAYFVKKLAQKRKNKHRRYIEANIECTVSMTDMPIIRWLHKTLKLGKVTLNIKNKSPSSKPHWKDQLRWRCYHRDAYKFAKLIISYTHVKRKKLQKIIDHYDKLPLRYTDDRDVRVHNPVSGDGNHILKEPKTRMEQMAMLTHDPIVD